MFLERFCQFKKVAHNGVIAGLCLYFYATNIRIICMVDYVRLSLLMLEQLHASFNQALLDGISSAFVIAIILCGVDKCVTTYYFQDSSWRILRRTL